MQIYSLAIGDFPVFSDNSTVYYMGNDSDYGELVSFKDEQVNDILVDNSELIVATTSGIYKYKLYVENILHESRKILTSNRIYQSTVDDDFSPSGMITANGNLYAYSGKGVIGLDDSVGFLDISADQCCTFQYGDGTTTIIVTSGKDIYAFDDQLFMRTHITAQAAVEDVKTTDNMILFRLADKTLWQIHKNNVFAFSPELVRVTAYVKIDDFTTYGEYAAVRQDTALKFLQEYVKPERLKKFSDQPVNCIQYNKNFDIIFISTKNGVSAAMSSDIDGQQWTETQVYSGITYGCWTNQNRLYCFVPHGVDVYDIVSTKVLNEDQEYETTTSYVFRHTVLKNQNKIVNGMCEFDGRQLYAASDGLYASKPAETYINLIDWPRDIQFCRKMTMIQQGQP